MYDYIRYSSPLGMLTVAAENGALTALVIEGQKYADRHLAGEGRECETPVLRRARCWLDDYFAGKNPDASALPLSPGGTQLGKGRRQRGRPQPHLPDHPLSPGSCRGRRLDRLRRRSGKQEEASAAGRAERMKEGSSVWGLLLVIPHKRGENSRRGKRVFC